MLFIVAVGRTARVLGAGPVRDMLCRARPGAWGNALLSLVWPSSACRLALGRGLS